MDEERITKLEERLNYLEFRQDLLFNNSEVDRLLYEYEIKQFQYRRIMDLMDVYRGMIEKKQPVNNSAFEESIYEIVPEKQGNYHFCEYIARAFMEEGRWEEVFPALYSSLPKYKFLKEKTEE